jgi:hypothetical protein
MLTGERSLRPDAETSKVVELGLNLAQSRGARLRRSFWCARTSRSTSSPACCRTRRPGAGADYGAKACCFTESRIAAASVTDMAV